MTTWNDAGSVGALTLEGFREFIVEPATVRITAFVNISSIGLVCDDYECANPWYLDVGLLRRMVERNRDLVRGVKVRMGNLLPLVGERARAAAACARGGRRVRAAADDAHRLRPAHRSRRCCRS